MDNLFKNKRILVVGMGRSGVAAMEAALEQGAEVSVQDSKSLAQLSPELRKKLEGNPVKPWLGCVPDDMGRYDVLILSPGVPTGLPFIEEARACGAEIIGELEFAYRLSKGNFVGITGTNGKTTTTTLVGEIYRAAGRDTYVVGNIGVAVLAGARDAGKDSWLITEVSSFQLETVNDFRPEVSAVLNVTPDHLDRHGNMENYARAKANIFRRQSRDQYFVYNADDEFCRAMAESCPATAVPFSRREQPDFGAFVKDGRITIRDEEGRETGLCLAEELRIPGTHNLENALAAAAIAFFGGIDPQVITAVLKEFAGVAHRIETCRTLYGVRFVNDSKGTNSDAAIKAIEAMKENIILIAGGYDKKADFTELVRSFDGRVKKVLLLGETAEQIRRTCEEQGFTDVEICGDMENCVAAAWAAAEEGDVVLLSPACASWDMYDNFEQRGDHFRKCVFDLRK